MRPDLAYARDHIDDLRAHCPGMPLENLAHFSGQWLAQLDLFCMIHATGVETVAAGQFLFGALSVLSQLASIGYGKPRGGSVLFWLGARTVPALLRRAVALGVLLDPPAATLVERAEVVAAAPLEDQLRALRADAAGGETAESPDWATKLARFQRVVLHQCARHVSAPPKGLGAFA